MILFTEWLSLRESAQYISSREYRNRLASLGWRIVPSGSHINAFAPDGVGRVTWSDNNWEKNWHQVARDLLRFAKGGRGQGGYENLVFVWENPFQIPKNFNLQTQSINKTNPSQELYVTQLMNQPEIIAGRQIKIGTSWKPVALASVSANGLGLDVMFDDESTTTFHMKQKLVVK